MDESMVIGFMEASMVGAGLVLAVYALIIPMSGRIFKELNDELKNDLVEFDKLKSKITPESKEEMKKLNKLRGNMENLKKFPRSLGLGVLITFLLYSLSTLFDAMWFFNPMYVQATGYIFVGLFVSASVMFFAVGLFAISMVWISVQNEFEEFTKKQKRVSSKNSAPSQK